MLNLDEYRNSITDARKNFMVAIASDDENVIAENINKYLDSVEKSVQNIAEQAAQQGITDYQDDKVLTHRGIKILTVEEKKYFNNVIENGGFEGLEDLMPETIINEIFDDLRSNHPLLSLIDTRNTHGITRWLKAKDLTELAFWGNLTDKIKEIAKSGFEDINIVSKKLSGFMPVHKPILALSPNWLATYVIEALHEALNVALEKAVVDGDGNECPIGMTRKLTGMQDGVYPRKDAIKLYNLTPNTIGNIIMKPIADGKPIRGRIVFVVHPNDYWSKIFPSQTILNTAGEYKTNVLPINADVVQSEAMKEGEMIVGIPRDYFLAVSGITDINKYTETLAIEDMDLFIIKFLGNGKPIRETSFQLFDISELEPLMPVAPTTDIADVNNVLQVKQAKNK